MAGRILLTSADGTTGAVVDDAGRCWDGPIPPVAGDLRALYDRLIGAGEVPVAYVAPPPAPATVTGNQWFFALADLGLSALWRRAKAVSKDKDQNRVDLIARDTPLLATDPLLLRVCANAGSNPDGSAVIDPAKVFAQALTEPL